MHLPFLQLKKWFFGSISKIILLTIYVDTIFGFGSEFYIRISCQSRWVRYFVEKCKAKFKTIKKKFFWLGPPPKENPGSATAWQPCRIHRLEVSFALCMGGPNARAFPDMTYIPKCSVFDVCSLLCKK